MSHDLAKLFTHPPRKAARARLICFPCAGGTGAAYAGWGDAFPDVDVCAVELGGRQRRADEPPPHRMAEIIDPLMDHAAELFGAPCVVFGHSLGGWMALELAHAMRDAGSHALLGIVVAGSRAPQVPRKKAISTLPDAEFLRAVAAMNGTPREIFEDADMVAYMLPRLRADFALAESYRPAERAPLDVPLYALGGAADPGVGREDLHAWQMHTTQPVEVEMLPGDHFFVRDQLAAVARVVRTMLHPLWNSDVRSVVAAPHGGTARNRNA